MYKIGPAPVAVMLTVNKAHALLPVLRRDALEWVKIDCGDYWHAAAYWWRRTSDGVSTNPDATKRSLARFIFKGCQSLADYQTREGDWCTKVTHRNGDKSDFRLSNLVGRRHRVSTARGYVQRGKKYRAHMMWPGYGVPGERRQQSKRIGSYDCPEDATTAYRYAVAWVDDGIEPPLDFVGSEVRRQFYGTACRISDRKLIRGGLTNESE